MKLFALIKKFGRKEEGAVTVDWVVLTAAVVALGIGALTAISGSVGTATTSIGTEIVNQAAFNS